METTEQDPFELAGEMTPAQKARHAKLVEAEAKRKAVRASGRAAITPAGAAALNGAVGDGAFEPAGRAELESLEAAGARQAEAIEQATGIEAMVRAGVKLALEELLRRGLAVVPTNDRRYELELAEGVEPIDRLQAARREAVARLAKLEAKYEVWDARRKNHRQGIMTLIDMELAEKDRAEYLADRDEWKQEILRNPKAKEPAAPKGRSEAELERLAASDPRVVAILDEAEEWLAELFLTRNEVKEYDEIVNRDQAVLRLRAREREL